MYYEPGRIWTPFLRRLRVFCDNPFTTNRLQFAIKSSWRLSILDSLPFPVWDRVSEHEGNLRLAPSPVFAKCQERLNGFSFKVLFPINNSVWKSQAVFLWGLRGFNAAKHYFASHIWNWCVKYRKLQDELPSVFLPFKYRNVETQLLIGSTQKASRSVQYLRKLNVKANAPLNI